MINVLPAERSEGQEEDVSVDAAEAGLAFDELVFLALGYYLSDWGHNVVTHDAGYDVLHYTVKGENLTLKFLEIKKKSIFALQLHIKSFFSAITTKCIFCFKNNLFLECILM